MTAAIAIPATTTPAAAALQGGAAAASSNASSEGNGFAAALAALIGGTVQPYAGPHAPKTHGANVPNAQTSEAQDPSTIVPPVVPGLVVPVPQPQQTLTVDAAAQINAQATQASALQILQAAQTPATVNGEQKTAEAKSVKPETTATGLTAPATAFAAFVANAQQAQSQTTDTKGAAKATTTKDVSGVQKTQPNGSGNAVTAPADPKSSANGNLTTAIQHALSGNANGQSGNGQSGNAQPGATHADTANVSAAASPVAIAIHTTTIDATSSQAPATEAQAPVPLDALAVNIARKFESGESRFEIRLAPTELGKLDISMTVTHDGTVQAVVRAERPETLDLLQRDARVLESQLRQSGLNVDSGSLSFSLGGGNNRGAAFADAQQTFRGNADATAAPTETVTTNSTIVTVRDGLDIRI